MRLKEGFITYEEDGEQILLSADTKRFSGLVRSNQTAAEIVECLKNDTTKEQIVEMLLAKYDVAEEQVTKDVDRVLDILRRINALDE